MYWFRRFVLFGIVRLWETSGDFEKKIESFFLFYRRLVYCFFSAENASMGACCLLYTSALTFCWSWRMRNGRVLLTLYKCLGVLLVMENAQYDENINNFFIFSILYLVLIRYFPYTWGSPVHYLAVITEIITHYY
jgi:hypothetical protein